jgi:hypothetical protein
MAGISRQFSLNAGEPQADRINEGLTAFGATPVVLWRLYGMPPIVHNRDSPDDSFLIPMFLSKT